MKHLDDNGFLSEYDVNKYDRPSVTNDVVIFTAANKGEENARKLPKKGLQVLLVKREEPPFKDYWALPGGFIKMDESLEEGAKNKLKEKTGIENVYIEQLGTFGDVNRDPRTRVISICNLALIAKDNIVNNISDSDKKKWFWVEKNFIDKKYVDNDTVNKYILKFTSQDGDIEIKYYVIERLKRSFIENKLVEYKVYDESSKELAFDHYKIIDYALERLKNKIEYTPIAMNLLPRIFTVKELQNVYEAILGREILNFRRKMDNMIVETEEKIEGRPFRPAKMFKFNEEWQHEF